MKSDTFLTTANRDPDELRRELGPYHYLHSILEETPNGVLVVGLNHAVIHANPASSHFLGVPAGELAGNNLGEVLEEHNADLFLLIEDHFESRKKKNGWKIRHEIEFAKDGDRCILSAVAVFSPSTPDYYLLYLIDITPQKKT